VPEQPDRPWLAWLVPTVGHPSEQRRPAPAPEVASVLITAHVGLGGPTGCSHCKRWAWCLPRAASGQPPPPLVLRFNGR
jgi:hypothetical protein